MCFRLTLKPSSIINRSLYIDKWSIEIVDEKENYLVRPPMKFKDFKMRDRGLPDSQLKQIKKALRTLHNLELMATTIYSFQIGKKASELNRQLISAMANEMTHYQDFEVKLYEYGMKPFKLRWLWWFVGVFFGLGSRLLGEKTILKTGIWVETKAVHHYGELLLNDWDEDTRKVIEKNRRDEDIHIAHWRSLLQEIG